MAHSALLLIVVVLSACYVSADQAASIMWNVVRGFGKLDPSWSADKPLSSWNFVTYSQGYYDFMVHRDSEAHPPGLGPLNLTGIPATFPLQTLSFSDCGLTGTLDLSSLPHSLQVLNIDTSNALGGTLDFSYLPSGLQQLGFSGCAFTGSVDLQHLPVPLEMLDLSSNDGLTGVLDVAMLPRSLTSIDLTGNNFTGTISVSDLPVNLQTVLLMSNKFSGTLDFAALPSSVSQFYISGNDFEGSLDLSNLPECTQGIDVSHNRFSGTIHMSNIPSDCISIDVSYNMLSGSLVFPSSIPSSIDSLDFSHNQFEGTLDISSLPDDMTFFYARGNKLSGSLNFLPGPQFVNGYDFTDNMFTAVNWTSMNSFTGYFLGGNQLSGVVDVYSTPTYDGMMNATSNDLFGAVDMSISTEPSVQFYFNDNPRITDVICPLATVSPCAGTWDSGVRVHNTSAPSMVVPTGIYAYTGTAGKFILSITASSTTAQGNGKRCMSNGGLLYGSSWGYIGGSPSWLTSLTPCLPSAYEYVYAALMGKKAGIQVFLTTGKSITFTRKRSA